MLDEYFQMKNVLDFMKDLKTNDCYFAKNHSFSDHSLVVSSELALYIFYDALFKYKLIIDDFDMFDEYLDQVRKVYRKFDDFEKVRFGIHKVLTRMTAVKYDIHDWRIDDRDELITLIYDKYIKDGYVFHGFSSGYKETVLDNEFVPERYENQYEKFIKIRDIFKKYKKDVLLKDFDLKKVFYTDDCLLGCYYSMYAPLYFFHFLTDNDVLGRRVRIEDYLIGDYYHLIRPLKRFMSNHMFREEEQKFILDVIYEEWESITKKDRELCLLAVPRNKIIDDEVRLSVFLKDQSDIFEVIDRLLSSKYNSILSGRIIPKSDIQVITLPDYYLQIKKEQIEIPDKDSKVKIEFLNAYGNVSILLILGSLFVSFGVILSIITMIGG